MEYRQRINALSQIRIVSLNYDRVFEHRFSKSIAQVLGPDFLTWHDVQIRDWKDPNITVQIHQPHGTLGRLIANKRSSLINVGPKKVANYTGQVPGLSISHLSHSPHSEATNTLAFGDTNRFIAVCKQLPRDAEIHQNIVSVDDFVFGADLSGYQLANGAVAGANVICVGISDMGFNQSRLDLSKAKSVIFTNDKAQLEKFETSRLPSEGKRHFLPNGVFATPLFEMLGRDV